MAHCEVYINWHFILSHIRLYKDVIISQSLNLAPGTAKLLGSERPYSLSHIQGHYIKLAWGSFCPHSSNSPLPECDLGSWGGLFIVPLAKEKRQHCAHRTLTIPCRRSPWPWALTLSHPSLCWGWHLDMVSRRWVPSLLRMYASPHALLSHFWVLSGSGMARHLSHALWTRPPLGAWPQSLWHRRPQHLGHTGGSLLANGTERLCQTPQSHGQL